MKATAAAKDTAAVPAAATPKPKKAATPKQKKAAAGAATACALGEEQMAAVAAAATPKEKQAAAATQRKKLLEPTPKKKSLVEPEPPTPYPKAMVGVEWSRGRVQARVGGKGAGMYKSFSFKGSPDGPESAIKESKAWIRTRWEELGRDVSCLAM